MNEVNLGITVIFVLLLSISVTFIKKLIRDGKTKDVKINDLKEDNETKEISIIGLREIIRLLEDKQK